MSKFEVLVLRALYGLLKWTIFGTRVTIEIDELAKDISIALANDKTEKERE